MFDYSHYNGKGVRNVAKIQSIRTTVWFLNRVVWVGNPFDSNYYRS